MKFNMGFYRSRSTRYRRNKIFCGRIRISRSKIVLLISSLLLLLYLIHIHQLKSSISTSLIIRPRPQQLRTDTVKQSTKVIVFWTPFFEWLDYAFGLGHQAFIDHKCPQSNCETTIDRHRVGEADAVVFHMCNLNVADLPLTRFSDQRWVFFLYEQPLLTWLDLRPLGNVFNWTMTFRRDSDINMMDYATRPLETTLEPQSSHATGKSKMVAWLVSNCYLAFSHRDRYVNALKKYVDVDIIGRCGREMPGCYPRNDSVHCYKLLEKLYKFYLSFENSICTDYVTEKFYNIVKYNMVPVVMGGADYASIAPPHSYISVHDFKSPRHLADYLLLLDSNDTLYNEYFEWKSKYEVYQRSKYFCDLCEKLHDTSLPPKSYENIHQWWVDKGNCSGVFDLPENEHSALVKYFDYVVDNLILTVGRWFNGILNRFLL